MDYKLRSAKLKMHHPESTALDLRAEGKLGLLFNFVHFIASEEVVHKCMHVVKAIVKVVC